jgi:endonuclease/exonuclease/phosphatase family metal-dependent hydrolase
MLLFLITALLFNVFNAKEPVKIRVMTFNISSGSVNEGPNSWQNRKKLVIQVIRKYDCDFIGLQEVLGFQLDEIMEELPEYDVVTRAREISPYEGEACPILYKKDKWELMDNKTLWLSETPEVPGSRSWDCDVPRIFTTGIFNNKVSGYGIYLYNTHFDNVSSRARLKSAAVMKRHILNNTSHEYILVTGDLNAGEDDEAIQSFVDDPLLELKDSYRSFHPKRLNRDATFYGWGGHSADAGSRVDYIFNSSNFKILASEVIDYKVNGKYPSDHCPVYAELELGTAK